MIGNGFLSDIRYISKNFGFLNAIKIRIKPLLFSKFYSRSYNFYFNNAISSFLERCFENVIFKYKNSNNFINKPISNESIVWVCWWQGKSDMPEIILKCYNDLLKNANGYRVVLITQQNYREFTDIPEFIIKKVDKGFISLTHLSDIIRFNLLKLHGGLWIDAAMWVFKPLNLPKLPLFTLKQNLQSDSLISDYKWCIGFFSVGQNNILAAFVEECLLLYWRKHDTPILYFLTDYIIYLAYTKLEDVRRHIDMVPYSSDDLHIMKKLMDQEYSEERMRAILESNFVLSLTWKIDKLHFNNKINTYYRSILSNKY